MTIQQSEWVKAGASPETGNCMEMRSDGDSVQAWDTKQHGGPTLTVPRGQFAALVDGAKRGEFAALLD